MVRTKMMWHPSTSAQMEGERKKVQANIHTNSNTHKTKQNKTKQNKTINKQKNPKQKQINKQQNSFPVKCNLVQCIQHIF